MKLLHINFSKAFNLVPHKLVALGMDSRVVIWVRDPCRSYTEGQSRRATIQGSQSNLCYATRECFGPTVVSSVCK